MKKCFAILFALLPFVLLAQLTDDHGAALTLPAEMLNTNVKDWQLNGVTILLVIQVLGRAFAGLRSGGGLVGIWRGIVFGTNTPKETLTSAK